MCLPPAPEAKFALGGRLSPLGPVRAEAGLPKKLLSHSEMVLETYSRCGVLSRKDFLARMLASSRFQSSRFFVFL